MRLLRRSAHRNDISISQDEVIIFMGFLLGFLLIIPSLKSNFTIDYYQYWTVAKAVGEAETDNIYTKRERNRIGKLYLKKIQETASSDHHKVVAKFRQSLEPAGTPFLYTVFYALNSGDYDTDYNRFRWVSLVFYLAGLLLLCRTLGFSYPVSLFSFVIFASPWFGPFEGDLTAGNINQFQLGALALTVVLKGWAQNTQGLLRPALYFVCGMIMGFLLMLKPNVIYAVTLLLVLWFMEGAKNDRSGLAGGFVVSCVLAYISSALFFGFFGCWFSWIRFFSKLTGFYQARSLLGLVGLALPRFVHWGLGLTAVLFLIKRVKGKILPHRDVFLWGAGFMIYLLTAPLVHHHYFIHALPLTLYLLRPKNDHSAGKLGLMTVALFFLFSEFVPVVVPYKLPNHVHGFIAISLLNALTVPIIIRMK